MGFFNLSNRKQLQDETFNVVQSISKGKLLYKQLIMRAHPDKNPENVELATELTHSINSNRFNYRELLELQERIKTELETKATLDTNN